MPQVVAAVVAAAIPATAATAITVFGTAISFATVIGYVGYTALTTAALRKLSPQVTGGIENKGTLLNIREPAAAQEFVYGQVRKGGVLTYIDETGEDNKFLNMIITLAGHEVEEIGDIYINDEIVSLDGSGVVTGDRWKSKVRIIKRNGSQIAVDPTMASEAGVPSSFIGLGIAHLYVRLEYDADVFGGGIPTFTAVVKGKKVYDPRTFATVWSDNAALCIRDYITSNYGLSDSTVNDTFFAAAANDCDDAVPLSGGGTQARYTVNGVVRADSTVGAALSDMMQSCNGALYYSGGEWKLRVGVYEAPVKSFTLDDLRSQIVLPTKMSRRDNFNRVIGTFVDGSSGWIENDYPPIQSDFFLNVDDMGIENTMDLPLPMVTNGSRAQRIAKQTLFRSREQMTISAEFGLSAMAVEVGDIIDLTISEYGWTNKEFEVKSWKLLISPEGGVRIGLMLRETSEEAFAWDAEEQAIISNNTTLPAYYLVPNVGLAISGDLRLINQQVVGALVIEVSSGSSQVDQFEVQYRQTGATEWTALGRSTSNKFEAVGVSDGFFDVRVRGINSLGIRGDWNTVSGFYVTIFAAPPQDVTNFSGNVVGNTLHLTWTPSPDLDLSHYKIRYSNLTNGAGYQNAIDIVKKVSRPANSVVIPAQTGTYFIKAVDKLGNLSVLPASIVIDTNVADIDALNVVETLQQDPTFAGSKSNVVVLSDDDGTYLTLDTSTLFDSISGDFDDEVGLFDGGGSTGQIVSSGTYQFDNYVDLGDKYVSRVSAALGIEFLDYADTFDSADGDFDAREGDFDGDPSQFDTISARTQVSFTDDDPAGSPTWSDWRDFIVGDISARAIRFRAILETSDANNAPAIRDLTATVDMPDRVESASDITYTGTYAVTFPSAFKVAPAIGIAASLANGDRYVISGKSRTGFTITTYTAGSVSTNPATFDYVAKGYGKELT
jgi:hypothetical protein